MRQKGYQTNAEYIESMMKQFKLVDMREQYRDLILEAESSAMDYESFLVRLLSVEEEGKRDRRTEKLRREACFEAEKRLEDIDYGFNQSLDRDKITELGRLDFIDAGENVIIIGPPGVGKSMIATGIGMNAISAGYRVLFANAKELVDRLYEKMQEGTLRETLKELNRIPLLIIDELSYLKMDRERESLFFQVIRHRYEKNSLIITTNLPMGRWDELFTGKLAATAILDRLVHHCSGVRWSFSFWLNVFVWVVTLWLWIIAPVTIRPETLLFVLSYGYTLFLAVTLYFKIVTIGFFRLFIGSV